MYWNSLLSLVICSDQVGVPSANGGPPVSTGQSSKVYGVLTDLRWQVGARLSLRFIYAHSEQSGAYTDNQIGVTADWALLGAQASVTQPPPGLSPSSPASTRSPEDEGLVRGKSAPLAGQEERQCVSRP